MASKKELSILFRAETQDFTSGIKSMNDSMKTLNKEMKLLDTEMKNSGTSVEGLRQKQELLTQKLQASAEKVKYTEECLQRAKDIYGENSEEVQKWTNKLLDAQTQNQAIQNTLDRTTSELEQLEDEVRQSETAFEKLKKTISDQENELEELKNAYRNVALEQGQNSDEARQLENQIQQLNSELQENVSKLNQVEKAFNGTESEAKGLKGILQGLKDAFSFPETGAVALGNALGEIVVDGFYAVKDAIADFTVDCIDASAEMNALASQFTSVFGDFEGEASKSLSNIAKETGVTENRMKGSFTQIASFAKVSGMDTKDALSLSERAMIAVADSAAFYDRSLEETTESLQSFLKGNYENDSALGVSCTETTRNTKANELYGKSFKDLSESQKQLTLLAMVEDANKLSGAMGQASRESETWANQTGNLKQAWKDFKAVIGDQFIDIAVKGVKGLSDFISNSAIPAVKDVVDGYNKFKDTLQKADDWVKKNETGVTLLGIAFAGLTAAVLAYNGASILAAASSAAETVAIYAMITAETLATGASTALGVAINFLTSPITLVIAAITALIAIGYLLITNWDEVSAFASKIWTKIKEAITKEIQVCKDEAVRIWNSIKNFFSQCWQGIKNVASTMWNGLKTDLSNAWNSIKSTASSVWNSIKSTLTNLWNSIKSTATNTFNSIKTTLTNIWNNIKSPVSSVWNSIKSTISNIWNNIKTTITNASNSVKSTITNVWNSIKTTITNAANNVKSTITNTFNAIKTTLTNMWNNVKSTITNAWNSIKSTISNAANSVKSTISNAFNSVKSTISNIFNSIKSTISSAWSSIKSSISSAISSVKSTISSGFNSAKSTVSSALNGIKSTASSAWSSVKSSASSAANSIKSTISSAFSNVKSKISSSLSSAKSTVTSALSQIKSKFTSFRPSWSIPKPKLPKVSVTVAKKSIGGLSVPYPKFSVSWGWKGGIVQNPMLFGTPNGLVGAGDKFQGQGSNAEAIIPLDSFYNHLDSKLESAMNNDMTAYAVDRLYDLVAGLELSLDIDGREFTRRAIAPNQRELDSYRNLRR